MNLEIEALRRSASKLTGRDAEFASSLIAQYDRRARLSERQWPWVSTLLKRAEQPQPEAPKAQVGNMEGLIALFDTARANKLKHPKIRFSDWLFQYERDLEHKKIEAHPRFKEWQTWMGETKAGGRPCCPSADLPRGLSFPANFQYWLKGGRW